MPETGRLRSTGLAASLGLGSVAIVLLAVVAVAASSISLLGRLAEQQAKARVQLAGASARERLRRVSEDALSNARVLGERPPLQRILAQGEPRELEPLLRRFCEASALDGCAVFEDDTLLAAAGEKIPWPEVRAAYGEQGERFLVAPRAGGPVLAGAVSVVAKLRGISVMTVRAVNARLLREIADEVGTSVRVTNYATYTAPADDPLTELHSEALSSGRDAVRRLKSPPRYAATVPISASTGEMIGLIDTELEAGEFDQSVRRLAWRLALIAIVVVAIAGFGGLLYGKWLVRPLTALRSAADRIGQGDFSAAIPAPGVGEVGALAQTMDDMRRNLVELTATLRRREAEARTVLSGIVEGVYAVDERRIIRYANPQVAGMLGRRPEELVGRFCGDVLSPEPRDGERPCERNCPILQARSSPQGRAAEQLCLADGKRRSVVILSAPPVEGQQVQVLRDETELEVVRRARDTVLANIAHEFRTPLAAQLASIELLHDGLDRMNTGEQRELFQSLERGVLRLMRLIDNLLESVRIEAGQLGIRHQPVVLAEVVEEATALVQPLLVQRRQDLDIVLPDALPVVLGDAQRLVQVFVNLLANASKFAPEATPIRVGGAQHGTGIVVWVEDEGPGLPGADPATIFQRFGRGADAEPEAPGLGLGLWIVRSIVERHGGEVGVERTANGRTRFTIRLPAGGEA